MRAHEPLDRGARSARDPAQYLWVHKRFKTRPDRRTGAVLTQREPIIRRMRLRFTKMHGAGNDFVVLDATREPLELSPEQLRAPRRPPLRRRLRPDPAGRAAAHAGVDFRYRIFNADGGEVEQCGNGARCFVRFVHEHGLTDKRRIRVETATG